MRTSNLIRMLQELDPSGDLEVSVGNTDILFVDRVPPWYDGEQEVLIRDDSSPYYDVVGGYLRGAGDDKIRIHTHSLEWMLLDSPEFEIHTVGYRQTSLDHIQALREYAELVKADRIPEDDDWVDKRRIEIYKERLNGQTS